MTRVFCSAVILLILCAIGLGENSKRARLLGSFDANSEDVLNAIDKVGMAIERNFDPQGDIFALRVCSNEPIRTALALSAGAPFLATKRLQKLFGIPESSMYYVRQNKNCKLPTNRYALTEYWFIPKDAEFPEFVEAAKVSNLSGYEIIHAGLVATKPPFDVHSHESEKLTPQLYHVALERIFKLLQQEKTAVTIITVPYYRRSQTPELHRRVNEALKHLDKHHIPRYRVHVRRVYSGVSVESPEYEPKYPDITVVGENLK